MKEENRMMQDEMMNEEEIIGKEIEKELENTPEKNTEKNAQKEKMINLMNRYHSSTGADKAEVVQELLEEVQGFLGFAITKYFPAFKQECYEDLYQECVVAFLENIDKYDPEKATITNFLTYPLIHAMCCNNVHDVREPSIKIIPVLHRLCQDAPRDPDSSFD